MYCLEGSQNRVKIQQFWLEVSKSKLYRHYGIVSSRIRCKPKNMRLLAARRLGRLGFWSPWRPLLVCSWCWSPAKEENSGFQAEKSCNSNVAWLFLWRTVLNGLQWPPLLFASLASSSSSSFSRSLTAAASAAAAATLLITAFRGF